MAFGNASGRTTQVAGAIAAFAIGLLRLFDVVVAVAVTYSYGDMRTPTLVNMVVVVVGWVAMAVLCWSPTGPNRVTMVGIGFSLSQMVGALVLWWSGLAHVAPTGARWSAWWRFRRIGRSWRR